MLDNKAHAPYQYHIFLIAHLTQAVHDHLGVPLPVSFVGVYGVGHLFVLQANAYWLRHVCRDQGQVVTGTISLAAYAWLLMPHSQHHPSDPFGTGLAALCLVAAAHNNLPQIVATSLCAGFLWTKHVLVAPVLFAYHALQGNWRGGLLHGAVVSACAGVGPIIYLFVLGYHPLDPRGILAPEAALASLPKTLAVHFLFAFPPLLSLLAHRSTTPKLVLAAILVYPIALGVYAFQGMFLFELRSFWIALPAFSALLALAASDNQATISRGGSRTVGTPLATR